MGELEERVMKAGEKSTITYRSGPNGELVVHRDKNDIIKIEKLMEITDEMLEDFPKFRDFTHEPPDNLMAEDFLSAHILEFADFYGYITALKEWFERWLKKTPKP